MKLFLDLSIEVVMKLRILEAKLRNYRRKIIELMGVMVKVKNSVTCSFLWTQFGSNKLHVVRDTKVSPH